MVEGGRWREGVKNKEKSEQVRDTHILESTKGETNQNIEKNQASKGHSQTGE